MPANGSPFLTLLRVAAALLAAGMLGWFVLRAAKNGREAASAVPSAQKSVLDVKAPPLANSSKAIGQPVFSTKKTGEIESRAVPAKGRDGQTPPGAPTPAPEVIHFGPPFVSPSSKGAPVFSTSPNPASGQGSGP